MDRSGPNDPVEMGPLIHMQDLASDERIPLDREIQAKVKSSQAWERDTIDARLAVYV
jgi:hypothetical protein